MNGNEREGQLLSRRISWQHNWLKQTYTHLWCQRFFKYKPSPKKQEALIVRGCSEADSILVLLKSVITMNWSNFQGPSVRYDSLQHVVPANQTAPPVISVLVVNPPIHQGYSWEYSLLLGTDTGPGHPCYRGPSATGAWHSPSPSIPPSVEVCLPSINILFWADLQGLL